MNGYPDWVDLLRYLGLDPITVWIEYRPALFVSLALLGVGLLVGLYWSWNAIRATIANFRHAFADRMPFYRLIHEVPEKDQPEILKALENMPLVYAIPAVAADDVPGVRSKAVGYILLTATRLIFTSGGAKVEFPLDSFDDANVRDGNKYMELKLIFDKRKPVFHLLGISRDHAQELFMKMHAFRVAIRENAG
jgi:hypothetical protein